MKNDIDLMLQFKGGDKTAFEQLFDKYHRPLINFCYRLLDNLADAEEIAQETFFQVHRAAPQYQPLAKFSTWLYTIAKNLCLNRIRDRYKERFDDMQSEESEDNVLEETVPAETPSPEAEFTEQELSAIIKQAISKLPPSIRIPFILNRYQELSYDEIANILELSVTAVTLRIHRAKQILTRKLEPYIKI
ncbi:MAG: sigma-70 family RNA polymerase sigma factor [Nitrospirae bacterium]|nr:sigma-70 family RNA polymerase sigma factor [Candidatus Troglogloeales bacterium]